jgi:hypothetical protein
MHIKFSIKYTKEEPVGSTRSKKKVKLSLCLTKHYVMKAYGGVDV